MAAQKLPPHHHKGQREVKSSRIYMKGIEFKNRQAWLNFECAAGIALQCIADSIFEARLWLKKFIGKKPKKTYINRTKWLWPELIAIQQGFNFRVN